MMDDDIHSEFVKPRKGELILAGVSWGPSTESSNRVLEEEVVWKQGLKLAAFGPHLTCRDAFGEGTKFIDLYYLHFN